MPDISFCAWLILLLPASLSAQPSGRPTTIGFDGFSDLSAVQTELGVTFTGATVLTCGGSLNCPAYPPVSGRNVVYDDPALGGLITAAFDVATTGFIDTVTARVTGLKSITMTAYDRDGQVLSSDVTGGQNCICSGSTIPPNKLLTVHSSLSTVSIARVTFHDSGNTFTVDDFTFYSRSVTVMVDAGHGYIRQSNGTVVYQRLPTKNYGLIEDHLTLDMALDTQVFLQDPQLQGIVVIQTRTGDAAPFAPVDCKKVGNTRCPPDVNARAKLAHNLKVDIFVSIHTNASDDPTFHGTEAFWVTTNKNAESLARSQELAKALRDDVVSSIGTRSGRLSVNTLGVLNAQNVAASLVEVAYHSNTSLAPGQVLTDEALLNSGSFLSLAASGISQAIIDEVGKLLGPVQP